MDAVGFLGDFVAIMGGGFLLAVMTIGGITLVYWAWQQAEILANDFRDAIGPSLLSRHGRAVLGLDIVRRLTAFLLIVSLVSVHDSLLVWPIVLGFSWSVLRIERWWCTKAEREIRLVA